MEGIQEKWLEGDAALELEVVLMSAVEKDFALECELERCNSCLGIS